MTIAKPSKDSNLLPLQKKQFLSLNNLLFALLPCLLLASLLGTYLDLYFTGKEMYSFPKRLLPDIFSIHIGFTLVVLPALTAAFLVVCYRISFGQKVCFILFFSLLMSFSEKQAEGFGFFIHHPSWKHLYSFIGFNLYLTSLYLLFHFLIRQLNKK
ncbi:CBO0543 family protein [Bacillus benzoevorans]|uniref:CBO0543 family protein n=1 Tax=Bacillus benzoevorans TaxID=1456 RepID=UPI0035F0EE8E